MGGAGGSGGSAGTAGTAGRDGGTGGSTAGTAGTSGGGGEGGAVVENPDTCVAETSTRGSCQGGCTLNAAFAVRCPSPLSDIEMAGSNLLIEHGTGATLFGFHFEGGLVLRDTWAGTGMSRELAVDGDSPIVVSRDEDGSIVVSTRPLTLKADFLLDAGYDAQTLRILTWNEDQLLLNSFDLNGLLASDSISSDVTYAGLVRGSSPPWVSLTDESGAAWLYGNGDPRSVALPTPIHIETPSFSAVAIGERAVLGTLPVDEGGANGTYVVEDDGVLRTFGNARTQICPASYIANYPDICEFDFVADITTPDAVLAAELVVHDGHPWLVSIVGDVTDRCETFSSGCIETLPCDCEYRRLGSTVNAALRLENLDDPSQVLRVALGDFPYETVQIAASSSDIGALFVAVAESQFDASGNQAGVFVDYLMLTP